ncbi:MAG: CopG family ribbon-helix-helix protein [Bacillota bacterium]
MPASRKIIVSVPDSLLAEMDLMSAADSKNRSEIVREAIKLYISERKKMVLREQLRKGYVEMGDINKAIAEESFNLDHEALKSGLQKLAE